MKRYTIIPSVALCATLAAVLVSPQPAARSRALAAELGVPFRFLVDRDSRVAGQLAIAGAQPLRYNGYKVPLMRNLVKRAIRGTGTAATT